MALTILDRPRGCKLSATENTTYSISTNGYGDAILTGGSGLSDGDKVYIYQSFTSYNGFWQIVAYGPSAFRLRQYSGADYLAYSQSQANVTIYECIADVDFSCVHLPIVYTLQSNKWPTNTADTIRNIVGFANDNGNVRLTLDGSIDADALDWLNIANSSEDQLDGPFQILTKYSATQFTIDAPYSVAQGSAYTYQSATAQKYYNNYGVNVKVYGGLRNTHQWAGLKPYTLITTISIPPDADNLVKANVAEMLKEKLNIQANRPNYDSMPYDLDRFCEFYIEYAEQYDEGDGTDVETFVDAYQSDFDFFQGVAVDAELPFKNRYSGFLSEYVYGDASNLAKFLSDGIPTIWPGYYFDLSLLNNRQESTLIVLQKYYDQYGNFISGLSSNISTAQHSAVFRVPLSIGASEYYQKVQVFGSILVSAPSGWTQQGTDTLATGANNWSITKGSAIGFIATQPFSIPAGTILPAMVWSITTTSLTTVQYDVVMAGSAQVILSGSQALNGTLQLNLPSTLLTGDATGIILNVQTSSGTTLTVSLESTVGTAMGPDATDPVTEDKRIDVSQDCAPQYIYLTWKNHLGGFNYWLFTSNKDYSQNIIETQEQEKNIYPQWPRSFGEHQDTINQETYRSSVPEILVRAENLTKEQVEFIKGIKLSSLVQQMTTKYDRRTMVVDGGSFKVRQDAEGLHNLEFTIRDTANNPAQGL